MKGLLRLATCFLSLTTGYCLAATLVVPIYDIYTQKTDHQLLGKITVTETPYGLLFTPDLNGLPAGIHGFHIHEKSDCGDNGNAAGGHFDPLQTKNHLGPYQSGHVGDLPGLVVTNDGKSITPLLAPRLKKLSDVQGHALMVHAQGDNYSDQPAKLGGGGSRMACGVINSWSSITGK